ncbi:MAG TPA: TetR/AcrR family transcriptional regulator C-terminal domain-containing protein [Jatrophihabitans sp.]|nr:TetR/AcrR family transcriptional regulator C-terminal domain-containing protein [Jatrophihabitans sp.]
MGSTEQTRSAASGRRGRGLSAERIARAALELMDESGVGAASMRAIGARLGVEAMSLYKHVATRDALLDAVVELVVAELNTDPDVQSSPQHGWREYLSRLAHGVRRYARAHPHAFPLVTTRPAEAPWVNPPLRSLPWIESLLSALLAEGFTDDQALFAYRSFNSFLLGYLLMETGAMTVHDPQPGDGSFSAPGNSEPAPVPGGLSPTRTEHEQANLEDAESKTEVLNPQDDIDLDRYPVIHRLARGLAEDHFTEEFESGLTDMLDRIAQRLAANPA